MYKTENAREQKLVDILKYAPVGLVDYRVTMPEIFIDTSLSEDCDNVIIRIQDNGPGIPEGILKTLLNPL